MKKKTLLKNVFRNGILIVLLCVMFFGLSYKANLKYKLLTYKYANDTGYYNLYGYPAEFVEDMEQFKNNLFEIRKDESYQKFITSLENVSIFLNAMNNASNLYPNYIVKIDDSIDISPKKMKKYPEIEQTTLRNHPDGDKIYRSDYNLYKSGVINSQNFSPFEVIRRSTTLSEFEHLPLFEGYIPEYSFSYSEYFGTDKPMPVVIGFNLKDLFELNQTYDAMIFRALTNTETENYSTIYPNGTGEIIIVGILDEDAYYKYGSSVYFLDSAIILPCTDIFKADYNTLKDEHDKQLYTAICQNLSTIGVYSDLNPKLAEERYLKIINEIGFDRYVKNTTAKYDYMIKGVSTNTYNKIVISVLSVLIIMSIVAIISEINNSVKRNMRRFAVYYMSGASPLSFLPNIALTIISDVCAGALGAVAAVELTRSAAANTNNPYYITFVEVSAIILCAALALSLAVILYSFIKLKKTDFSRVLKEGE